MALTKVTGQVIKNTTDVTVGVLTVTNTLAVGGTVSIGGTLTYEDVTNVDAVGLITARNGIVVGSGITLSKDGDVFFTGIATGNGSGLTALNASNIGSGTVPTARLGSGTASSSTFLRGDSTFQTVNTDLVSDTSPQLGGNLDVNTKNITFGDSGSASDDRLTFGAGTDLSIYHDGTKSVISDSGTGWLEINTNNLRIQNAAANETLLYVTENGSVQLQYDNSKKLETSSNGVTVTGTVTADGLVLSDNDEIQFGNSTDFRIYHDSNNSFIRDVGTGSLSISGSQVSLDSSNLAEYMVRAIENGAVELYHDGVKKLETNAGGITLPSEAGGAQFRLGAGSDFQIEHDGTNSYIYNLTNDLLIQCDNNVEITAKTGGTKRFRFDSDGLKFGSDTAAANALDDYEEGTFTYTHASGGNVIVNSTGRTGFYIKIGRVVHVWGQFATDTTGNYAVGTNIRIHDLPFVTDSTNTPNAAGIITVNYTNSHQTTVGVVHISGTDELHGRVTATSGHSITGSGHYFQVSYVTAS